jgi:SAM-dependent methyltransferase
MQQPIDDFSSLLKDALTDGRLVKLVLAKPRATSDLNRTTVRPLTLKCEPQLSFVDSHETRDITRNLGLAEGLAQVHEAMAHTFSHAHLFTTTEEIQLLVSKKGRQTLLRSKSSHAARPAAHDRAKQRYVDIDRDFLSALGVTDAQHHLVPAMARKWRQINKFVEVLDHALAATGLKTAERLDVVDFGSGKGYLTFAMHDHLRHTLGLPAQVAGVDLKSDMVALCNAAVDRLGLEGLRFEEGDVRSVVPPAIDVMIALHACDTATDHAIHTGVRAGAKVIMCSPCCHKELRPQLLSPHPLRPILKHGVHLGQQAEMLTDGLRAMLLDACGYDTQVFEFIALEHTNKNKMILAVKRPNAKPAPEVWRQVDELKAFYGIRDQCLETLLMSRREAAMPGSTGSAPLGDLATAGAPSPASG